MPKSLPGCSDMSMLLDLQMRLRRAVLGGDTAEIVAAIQGDGLNPAARVGIYRNHAFTTLGDALQGTFPVVCRLVDQRFFAYAAHEYLREHPPHSRCLVEYGADFADFLARFSPCEKLP
ncbi:MAG: DNA-binding domain-containing protein, partial [Stellaceae bacterium]